MAGTKSWKQYSMALALAQRAVDLLVDKEVSQFDNMGIDLKPLVTTHRASAIDLEMKQDRRKKKKINVFREQKQKVDEENSSRTNTQQQTRMLTVLSQVHTLADRVRKSQKHF